MRKWGRRLVFSVQFMTHYPVNVRLYLQPNDFPSMSTFFPLDGFLIGLFACFLAWLGQLTGSLFLTSVMVVLAYVVMSGAFQIEGLAKSFNALGRRSRALRLEAMNDPRLNPRGIAVVVVDILLIAVLVFVLCMQREGWAFYIPLLIVPAVSRLGIVSGCLISKSAKAEGIGRPFIIGIRFWDLLRATILALLITIPFLGWETALILCGMELLLGMLIALIFSGFLGGITGDVLGCINEIGQIFGFVLIVIFGFLELPFSSGILLGLLP